MYLQTKIPSAQPDCAVQPLEETVLEASQGSFAQEYSYQYVIFHIFQDELIITCEDAFLGVLVQIGSAYTDLCRNLINAVDSDDPDMLAATVGLSYDHMQENNLAEHE